MYIPEVTGTVVSAFTMTGPCQSLELIVRVQVSLCLWVMRAGATAMYARAGAIEVAVVGSLNLPEHTVMVHGLVQATGPWTTPKSSDTHHVFVHGVQGVDGIDFFGPGGKVSLYPDDELRVPAASVQLVKASPGRTARLLCPIARCVRSPTGSSVFYVRQHVRPPLDPSQLDCGDLTRLATCSAPSPAGLVCDQQG
jgi:hypothetical protein